MTRAERIAQLNDIARTAMGAACRLQQTAGINALPAADQSRTQRHHTRWVRFATGLLSDNPTYRPLPTNTRGVQSQGQRAASRSNC